MGGGETLVNYFTKETDIRIIVDDMLRQAGWDPVDKAMVQTEVPIPPLRGAQWWVEPGDRGGASVATDEEAKAEIPTLQTYRKGPGEKIPDWNLLECSIYGIDVSRQLIRISMMNLVLHSIRNARVNLAAGRYKPQVAEKAPEEDPVGLIREVLAIEREITEGLEKLLKEIEG